MPKNHIHRNQNIETNTLSNCRQIAIQTYQGSDQESSVEGRDYMNDRRRARSNSAMLAASSILAVLAGVAANFISFPIPDIGEFKWSEIISMLAGLLAGVTSALLAERTLKGSLNFDLSEEAAIRRIKIALSDVSETEVWSYPDSDLQLSVMLRRDSPSQAHLQSSSAFIARLTSDPRCTIITGLPGSGKTMLLRHVALQMATAREHSRLRFTPLLLGCQDWSNGSDLVNWVGHQTRRVYGIPAEITRSWITRGTALLILDGADEISHEGWPSFVLEVNNWLNSPVGGRVILSCRNDAYVSYFQKIRHEQVANLEPLSQDAIRQHFTKVISENISDPSKRAEAQSLLRDFAFAVAEGIPGWSTPLLVRILTDAVLRAAVDHQGGDTRDDPGALAVELGDSLSRKGDQAAAIESYMAAIKSRSPQWRPLATLRASLLLARSGDHEGARETLERSLAAEIERPLHSELLPIEDDLSIDERAVLSVLSPAKSLDAFQVSSLASVPPSRCNSALRQLRERGLVEVADNDDIDPRFQRSAVELIEQ